MATDYNTLELGQMLGQNIANFNSYRTDFAESEEAGDLQIYFTESLKASGIWTAKAYYLSSSSFYMDHPIYGEIDSSILNIDGGYLQTVTAVSFPLTFPITFTAVVLGSTVLSSGLL